MYLSKGRKIVAHEKGRILHLYGLLYEALSGAEFSDKGENIKRI